MSVPGKPAGLRERKKLKTRETIRREALRLIKAQGYHNTTVEQIAAAAEVSPRTFSRYFPVKEAVLPSDDHIAPIIEAFVAAPAHLPPIEAYRYAVVTTFNALTDEQREDAIFGQRLMYAIPEARGLLYTEYVRLIDLIAEGLAKRPDAPATPDERRVLAGAMVGVLIAASHNTPLPGNPISHSLHVLDGMLKEGTNQKKGHPFGRPSSVPGQRTST